MDAPASLAHKTTPEYSVYSYDACSANCVLTLTAPDIEEQERAPVSCSFVLDISGSMQGSKLNLMKKASQFSLKQLSGKDHLGLIAFGSEVHHALTIGPVTASYRARAERELARLQAHTCTNLAGGLFAGITQQLAVQLPSPTTPHPPNANSAATRASGNGASTTPTPDNQPAAAAPASGASAPQSPSATQPIRSIFLFTDGRPTVGMREPRDILKVLNHMLQPPPPPPPATDTIVDGEDDMCDTITSPTTDATDTDAAAAAAAVAAQPNIKVHTFGFGQDSDPNLLAAIADRGSGSYYFIDNPDDIPAAFADALGGILSVAAQNVVLRVSPVNGARVTAVRSGFPTTREGADFVVRVPDVYAEEVKDLVVCVELPSMHGEDVPEDCEFTAARVTVEFIDTVQSRPAVVVGEVRVKRSAEAEAEAASTRVRAQLTRLDAMDSMLQAMSLADRGDYNNARGVLRGIEEGLQSLAVSEAPTGATDSDAAETAAAAAMVQQLRDDVRNMASGYSSRSAYNGGGRAYGAMMSKSHATQRSTHVSTSAAAWSLPAAAAAAGAAAAAAASGAGESRHAYRARTSAATMPLMRSPPSARPRSSTGADPDTPTKKSRVKMFLNQMTGSFRRSSRDGGVATASATDADHSARDVFADPMHLPPTAPPPNMAPPGAACFGSIPEDGTEGALAGGPDAAGPSRAAPPPAISVYSNRMQTRMVTESRSVGKGE